jgi:hypothetical protein
MRYCFLGHTVDEPCWDDESTGFNLGNCSWPRSRLFGRDANSSNHFGNDEIGLFRKSYAFPWDHDRILSHCYYRYEVFKDEQREQLWEDRRLARKTRPPDLDYRDMEFVTKCDRRMCLGKGRKRWIPNYQGWARAPRRSRGGPRHRTHAGRMVSRQPATGCDPLPKV